MTSTSRPQWASAVFLLALLAIHAVPLLPALGLSDCFCDETMCVHRHGHAGAEAATAQASSPAHPSGAHCNLAAAKAAAVPDCTMRGCSHERDHSLLTLGAGVPAPEVAMAAPEGISRVPVAPSPPLLDRLPWIETPPPDFLPV